MTTRPIRHGGNPHAVRKRLGLGDRPLLDFSASLNPLGPPPSAIEAARKALDRAGEYPEPGCPRLTARLAALHLVADDQVIVGAGTSQIIGLIAQSMREAMTRHAREDGHESRPLAHLVEPAFGEYRRASALNGLNIMVHGRPTMGWGSEFLPPAARGIYWTGNPTSPVGLAWQRDRLLGKVDRAHELLVVVDEAYLPFFRDEAARTVTTAAAARTNLLALRSVTKIFAMPGIRVGYAVTSAEIVDRLRRYQDPWSVDAPSEAALLAALDDTDYLDRSIALIEAESAWLTERLWNLKGVRPVWPERLRPPATAPRPNWVLISLVDTVWTSAQVHEELARRGILVRECSDFAGLEPGSVIFAPDGPTIATRGHLRVAVRTRGDNDRLLTTLADVLRGEPTAVVKPGRE